MIKNFLARKRQSAKKRDLNAQEKPIVEESKEKKSVKIDIQKAQKESQNKKISFIVFIWSALLFFFGLQYDFLDEFDTLLFWLPIFLIICVIIYQIFFLTNNRFVLFEIFLFYLLLHLVYMMGYYGLRGSDSYIDYNVVKGILNTHSFNLDQSAYGYPMMHIFSSAISLVEKIDPFIVAKFLPSIISSLIVFPIYLLSYSVYNNSRIALFSCLIFGTIPQFMSFEAVFVREVFGLFFMILFFYILYISSRRLDFRFFLLVFILIPACIFAHHLSSVLLLALLVIYFIVSKLLPYFFRVIKFLYRKGIGAIGKLSSKLSLRFLLVIFVFSVCLFGYWAYLYGFDFAFGLIDDIYSDIFGFRDAGGTYSESINLGSPIVTIKGNIIYYGFFLFNGLFAFILLINFFMTDITRKVEDSAFMVFYFLSMFLGFLTMFVVSFLAFPDRFLPFGFMFGLIPITGFILVLKKNLLKKIIVVFLISFMVFNLYNVESENYTYNATFTGGATSENEYLIANQINFPDIYYGYIAAVAAIYDVQDIPQRDGGIGLGGIEDLYNSSSLAVINEQVYVKELKNLKTKSLGEYLGYITILSFKDNEGIDKICDLGHIYVVKGGG